MNIERNIDMNFKNWLRHIIIFLTLTSIAGVVAYVCIPLYWMLITMGAGMAYVLIVFEFIHQKKKKEYYNQWKKEGLI